MKNMSLEKIAQACGGVYHGSEEMKQSIVESITTDSRQAAKGCLFVAIPGERVDGHDFIPSVFEKGALAVLSEKELENPAGPYIQVASSLEAVKGIAEYYRQQLDIKVVGITGSVGRTSTKEVIASVLAQKYNVLKTLGNFNNELGLPLTVFRLRDEHQIEVLEMGISHFGEMHRLAKVARPDICVITNIGQCHLEFLKDRDGILRAKTEIFDFLKEDGCIILNGDDDKLDTIEEVKASNRYVSVWKDRSRSMPMRSRAWGFPVLPARSMQTERASVLPFRSRDGTWYSMHWQRRLSAGHWD